MATAFTLFPQFDVDSYKTNARAWCDHWIGQVKPFHCFETRGCRDTDQSAAKLIHDRKRALLFQNVGEGAYDINETHKGDTN